MDVIDLKQQFGDRYKIEYEESYQAQRERTPDPWLMIIPCVHGHIYVHGDGMLGAATDNNGATATKLVKLANAGYGTVVQRGDDGVNIIFPVDNFDKFAEVMEPRRRRKVSESERKRLADMGRETLKRHHNAQPKKSKRKRRKNKPGDSEAA